MLQRLTHVMSEKYNSSKRPRRFTEEIMPGCLYYWRHYVSQFYSASLNSMFKIHFKEVAKYLLCSTKRLMTVFLSLYTCWKGKNLAVMRSFMLLFYSDLSVHKWTKTLRKLRKEHSWTQKFSIFTKAMLRSLQNGWIFLSQDRIHCLVLFPDWDHLLDSFSPDNSSGIS